MSKDYVSRIAYLIGVSETRLADYDENIIKKFSQTNKSSIIRNLCQIRNVLLSYYYNIERDLKDTEGKISRVKRLRELYDSLLNRHGIDMEPYGADITQYISMVNNEIKTRIDEVFCMFPATMNSEVWDFIRNLFSFPKGDILEERNKFNNDREMYPFYCYINWSPIKAGNILENDIKFLTILFENNGKTFKIEKIPKKDALANIFSFVNECKRVIMGVDCENIDYIMFFTALTQFNSEIINRIEKIVLFNDNKLQNRWNFYNCDLPVKFEHVDCPRIKNNKSTLDVKMASYLTAAHYRDGIDGFMIVSSDSDFWGLIDTIASTSKIYVIGTKENLAVNSIWSMDSMCIPYCVLDVFNNKEISDNIKEETYKNEIITLLEKTKLSIDTYINMIQSQITYFPDEDRNIFRRIACGLNISFDEKGNAILKIQ